MYYELVLILKPPNQVIPVVNLNKLSGYKYTINESVVWKKGRGMAGIKLDYFSSHGIIRKEYKSMDEKILRK